MWVVKGKGPHTGRALGVAHATGQWDLVMQKTSPKGKRKQHEDWVGVWVCWVCVCGQLRVQIPIQGPNVQQEPDNQSKRAPLSITTKILAAH